MTDQIQVRDLDGNQLWQGTVEQFTQDNEGNPTLLAAVDALPVDGEIRVAGRFAVGVGETGFVSIVKKVMLALALGVGLGAGAACNPCQDLAAGIFEQMNIDCVAGDQSACEYLETHNYGDAVNNCPVL